MSEQQNPHETQMAVDSSGEDAVGTTEDPADRPEDVGPDAVPPRRAESNEYDKE